MTFRVPKLKWGFIGWEVGFPIGVPVALALMVMLFWETGPTPMPFSWKVVFDLTPWTLTFFAITLLSSSLRRLQAAGTMREPMFWMTLVLAGVSALYFGLLVIFRHTPNYEPGKGAYVISSILCVAAIQVCYATA